MSEVFAVEKIRDGFWIIQEGGVRIFVFEGSEKALVIDTGNGGGDLKSLVESLTQKPIMVAITHGDGDHTSANSQFGEAYMHISDYAFYRDACNGRGIVGAGLKPLYDKDIIDLGGVSFEVVFIPGHTPGSVAFLDRENRILIAGDSVNDGPVYMAGIFRSFEGYVLSIQKLIDLKDAYDTIYFSHGTGQCTADLLPMLIEGANEVFKGNVEGTEVDTYDGGKAKYYAYKNVSFTY